MCFIINEQLTLKKNWLLINKLLEAQVYVFKIRTISTIFRISIWETLKQLKRVFDVFTKPQGLKLIAKS